MNQDYNQNFTLMKTMKKMIVKLQEGFSSTQIPVNVIIESLATKVDNQFQTYLNRMTIQMAAESNNIFKVLLRDMEDAFNNLWRVTTNIDNVADRINDAKNSVVGKINVEIAKASKDNGDHVDEVMDFTTNMISNEIRDTAKHLEDELQETQSQIIEASENSTQLILTEQCGNFSKGLSWIDEGMNRIMIETRKKDTDSILKAQEDNLFKTLNWIKDEHEILLKSVNNILQEVRTIKKSNSFDDLKLFQ
jgi:hypothetical protein